MNKNLHYTISLVCLVSALGASDLLSAQIGGDCPPGTMRYYYDEDGDGFGRISVSGCYDYWPENYVPFAGDCDDNNPEINPNTIWYEDQDGDGLGDPGSSIRQCTAPPGYVLNNDDQCPYEWSESSEGCPEPDPDPDPDPVGLNLSDENYVFTRVYQRALSSSEDISSWRDVIEQVTYYDGLGRPKQQVAIRAGAAGTDLVTPIVYDPFGRQTKDYLPVPMPGGGVGEFRSGDMETAAATYYRGAFAQDFAGMTNSTANPYSEQLLEASPLNRVLAQGAPGKDWALGSGHEIAFKDAVNDSCEVRLYQVSLDPSFTPTLVASGYYQAHQLFKRITYQEQHTDPYSKDHTTQEFTDKLGRVVLQRRFEQEVAHDTYYVYDDYGNLTYIIPPKVETSEGISAPELNELGYQYQYDHRNRLIKKKVPGKGWEHIVYNKLDYPILTQDANLREQDQWLFTKYDAFGRVLYTGVMSSSHTRADLQAAADSLTTHYEQRVSTATPLAGTSVYYSNAAYPTTHLTSLHSIHYYDRYLGSAAQAGISLPATNHYGQPLTDKTKTLATVSRIRVLGTPHWITRVMAYDAKGREIWSREKNPYLDSDHLVENQLDFVGKVEQSRTTHIKNGTTTIIEDSFTYDHMGRPLTHTQKINNQPQQLIARNHYDDLGRLVEKQVGGPATGQGLQGVDYNYTVRGWLTHINDPDHLSDKLFAFEINYNNPPHGGTPLYTGNISQTRWKTANDHTLRWYRYDYDALSRLTKATAYSSRYNLNHVSYDKNGNITTLSRQGAINASASSFGVMDNLTYTYEASSNRLRSVNDAGSASYGFKDASAATTQYTYDSNGNLTSDANKGITQITYNHLNLPTEVTFHNSTSQVIKYTYDAMGVKLSKEIPGKTTQYAGSFIYESVGSSILLQFFPHPEGYVSYDNGQFNYVYHYKDHLGNIRLSYTDANKNGTIEPASEIISEKNYYPFGLTHRGYNGGTSSLGNDAAKRYGFGGKELQNENISGNILDWYDVSARNYDPALGRWMSIDPHAERYTSWSPSSFVFNNPLIFIDPDGRDPIYAKTFWGRTTLIGDDGKDDGQSYLVRGAVKRDVRRATKAGENYTGSLTENDNVFKIPTGGVMEDVINSVNDTRTSEKEHGGHANFGDANATRWDEGTPAQEVKDPSGKVIGAKASMNAFMVNGQSQMPLDASNVEYWWHSHPNTSVGGTQLGNSNPSPADFRFQTTMENRGFKGNTFVIGVRSGTVTFYNKNKSLITIKYSDFNSMGGK